EIEAGLLSRIGLGVGTNRFSIAAGLLVATAGVMTSGPAGGAAGLLPILGNLADASYRRQQGAKRIWSALIKHGGTIQDELPRATESAGNAAGTSSTNPWGIEPEPSAEVKVAPGMVLHWNTVRPVSAV